MDISECDCVGCSPEWTEDLSERLIKIVDQYTFYTGATLEPKQERAWHQRRRVLRVRWYFVHLRIAIRGRECDEW